MITLEGTRLLHPGFEVEFVDGACRYRDNEIDVTFPLDFVDEAAVLGVPSAESGVDSASGLITSRVVALLRLSGLAVRCDRDRLDGRELIGLLMGDLDLALSDCVAWLNEDSSPTPTGVGPLHLTFNGVDCDVHVLGIGSATGEELSIGLSTSEALQMVLENVAGSYHPVAVTKSGVLLRGDASFDDVVGACGVPSAVITASAVAGVTVSLAVGEVEAGLIVNSREWSVATLVDAEAALSAVAKALFGEGSRPLRSSTVATVNGVVTVPVDGVDSSDSFVAAVVEVLDAVVARQR